MIVRDVGNAGWFWIKPGHPLDVAGVVQLRDLPPDKIYRIDITLCEKVED